jgi:hypothetical protein
MNINISSAIMTAIITAMMIVMIMAIYANCHYRESGKIGRVIAVVIGRVVRHIHW